MNFDIIKLFELKIANFFGSPYAVATDSCTHGIELSLRSILGVGYKIQGISQDHIVLNKVLNYI